MNQAPQREQNRPDEQAQEAADDGAAFHRAVDLVVHVDLAVLAAPDHRGVVDVQPAGLLQVPQSRRPHRGLVFVIERHHDQRKPGLPSEYPPAVNSRSWLP